MTGVSCPPIRVPLRSHFGMTTQFSAQPPLSTLPHPAYATPPYPTVPNRILLPHSPHLTTPPPPPLPTLPYPTLSKPVHQHHFTASNLISSHRAPPHPTPPHPICSTPPHQQHPNPPPLTPTCFTHSTLPIQPHPSLILHHTPFHGQCIQPDPTPP